MAGLADPLKTFVVPRPRLPKRRFILASDRPDHVEAPGLPIPFFRIPERTQWNGEFRRPTLSTPGCRYLPDRPPVDVEFTAFVCDERFELRAVGVRGKDERVATVVEGVKENRHGVVAGELDVTMAILQNAVARENSANDSVRFPIEGHHRHIEILVVNGDPDFSVLCCGGSFGRFLLQEISNDLSLLPKLFSH